ILEVFILLCRCQQLRFSNPEHLALKREPAKREQKEWNPPQPLRRRCLRTATVNGQSVRLLPHCLSGTLLPPDKSWCGNRAIGRQREFAFEDPFPKSKCFCVPFRPKTGFQMWLEENRSSILADDPHLEETEIIKEGMSRFRALSSEERMAWTEKAKGREVGDPAEGKKRKRLGAGKRDGQEAEVQASEADTSSAKKSKSFEESTITKLSAFAYKQS
uniref:WD repeat and HMG-box DNA-binding protein 1 n=1 Tax=Varanus komodoensis TaxID=61221 RepID=A0A8D2IT53_VARKO